MCIILAVLHSQATCAYWFPEATETLREMFAAARGVQGAGRGLTFELFRK
jgi:hypothetical protein